VARRGRFRPAVLLRKAFFVVAGSLLMGVLAVLLDSLLVHYIPQHFAVSIAVGVAVAATFALLRFFKHPPLFLKNVNPLAAGLCAGLGVHVARFWLR
jgi:hypothetical protein